MPFRNRRGAIGPGDPALNHIAGSVVNEGFDGRGRGSGSTRYEF